MLTRQKMDSVPQSSRPTVLLINPCYDKADALGPFSSHISSQLPMSLGFLAGYLLQKNIGVHIVDEQLRRIDEEDLLKGIEEHDTKVVGISVLTLTAPRAYELGAFLKRSCPSVKVVMGGVHVTLLPEEPLVSGCADVVVRGEGELTLHELVERIHDGFPYGDVRGISRIEDGRVIHGPERPMIDDLDTLPPFPYHLFEPHRERYQFGNMLTSRGCPYDCIFCSQRAVSGHRYRARSAGKIFEELETLVFDYGQDFVFINDDNFVVDKDNIYALCDLIDRRELPERVRIGFHARGDALDAPLLRRMRNARFAIVMIGFETGSERIMAMVRKGETVREIEEGVRIAKECGMVVGGQFILGFPTETRAESLQTIRHALRLPIDFTRFNLLLPYPGTEVFRMLEESGGTRSRNWAHYATHAGLTGKVIPYVPEGRSAWELRLLQWFAHLAFFLRPKQLLDLGNMKYATAGQLHLPDPKSFRGALSLAGFMTRLLLSMVQGLLKKRQS